MSTLLDLSKRLKVRAEVLRDRIADAGQTPPGLDETLPPEVVEWLVSEYRTSPWNRLKGGFRGFLRNLRGKRGPVPVPRRGRSTGTEGFGDERDPTSEPLDWGTEGSLEREVPSFADEDPTVVAAAPPHRGQEEPPDRTPDFFPAEAPQPTGSESLRSEPAEVPPLPPNLPDRFPTVEAGQEPEEKETEEILDFLSSLSQIKGTLDRPEADQEKPPPFQAEEGSFEEEAETEFPAFEEIEEEEPEEEGIPVDRVDQVSSEELQARVDDLYAELPPAETAPPPVSKPPSHRMLAAKFGEFYRHLSPREKALIVGSAALAVAIFSVGVTINRRNYGTGGDERFYREGMVEMAQAEWDQANESFQKVAVRYPSSPLVPDAYFRMAEVAQQEQDYLTAGRHMREGLRLQQAKIGDASEAWGPEEVSKRWDAFEFLGSVNSLREDWDQAIEWYERLLHETPENKRIETALYGLANANYWKALREEAETSELRTAAQAYEAARDASPESLFAGLADLRMADIAERLAERESGLAEQHLKDALEHYQHLLARDESHLARSGLERLDVELHIARLHRQLGEIEESLAIYRQILARPRDLAAEGPPPAKIHFGLSRTLLDRANQAIEAHNTESAQADLNEVLEAIRPNFDYPFTEEEQTESVYLRGHAYYALGRLHLSQNGDLENPFYLKMDSAYQSALSRDPHYGKDGEDSLLAWMRRTNYLFQINKNYQDAAQAYEKILEEFPDSRYSFLARFRLAEALFALERYQNAEEQYRKAVEEFPQTQYTDDEAFRQSYFQLGYCQFLLEKYDEAAATYKNLLQLLDYEDSEESLTAWKRLAWAYYLQNRFDEAITEYRALLAKYPDRDEDGSIRVSLGRFLLERFDYTEARKQFSQVIAEHPGDEMARWSRYLICESFLSESKIATEEERGQLLASALSEAESIRTLYPDEDRILSIMGQIYFDLGDYRRSARELEYYKYSARERKPPAEYQFRLAESYYRLEDYKNAAINFKQLDYSELEREEQARALYLFAESLRLDGQLAEAIETYQRMLDEFPASAYHDMAVGRVQEVQWNLSKGFK